MMDFWRKTWFFGLGLLDFTKEKVESVVEEMVKRGEVSQQDSSQVVEQIMARAQEAQDAFLEKVKELIKKGVSEMKLARAVELEALEKRVAALEKELQDRFEALRDME
jgi:polyhydroxyalkanoate synthesis regulator phasin